MIPELISPPPSLSYFRTGDPDEVRALQEKFGSHRREPRGKGAFRWEWRKGSLGAVSFCWTESALPQVVEADAVLATIFHLPLDCRVVYEVGGRRLSSAPERGVLLPAGSSYTSVVGSGRLFAIAVDDDWMRREIRARDGVGNSLVGSNLEVSELPMIGRRTAELRSLVYAIRDSMAAGGEAGVPDHAGHFEALVVDWMADQFLRRHPGRRDRHPGAERLRRVEEWIDANLAKPITLGALCDVGAVSARALQMGFRKKHGLTPMQYVVGRRLDWVRMRLSRASAAASITEIAMSSGFSHLGRFSVLYRSTFGESPSSTLEARRLARRL